MGGPDRVVRGELVGEQPGPEAPSVLRGASIGITPDKGGNFEAHSRLKCFPRSRPMLRRLDASCLPLKATMTNCEKADEHADPGSPFNRGIGATQVVIGVADRGLDRSNSERKLMSATFDRDLEAHPTAANNRRGAGCHCEGGESWTKGPIPG